MINLIKQQTDALVATVRKVNFEILVVSHRFKLLSI